MLVGTHAKNKFSTHYKWNIFLISSASPAILQRSKLRQDVNTVWIHFLRYKWCIAVIKTEGYVTYGYIETKKKSANKKADTMRVTRKIISIVFSIAFKWIM